MHLKSTDGIVKRDTSFNISVNGQSLLVQATKCESASPLFPRHKFVPVSWIRTGPVGDAGALGLGGTAARFMGLACSQG